MKAKEYDPTFPSGRIMDKDIIESQLRGEDVRVDESAYDNRTRDKSGKVKRKKI